MRVGVEPEAIEAEGADGVLGVRTDASMGSL